MSVKLAATLLIVVAVVLPGVCSRKIPSYVKVCKKSDPDFDACLINSVETLRPWLNKGIPEMNVPSIEPFELSALEINRDFGALKMRILIQNGVAYGGSGFVINSLKTDIDKLALELSITLPRIDVTAEYDVHGRFLVRPIKGSGVFKRNLADVHVEVKVDTKVITKEGVEYLQVNKIQMNIQVGASSVKISDKDDTRGLPNESTAQFYNQNENQTLHIIRETAEEVLTEIVNKILSTFPLSELLPA